MACSAEIHGLIKPMAGWEEFTKTLDHLSLEPLGRNKYVFHAKFTDAKGNVGHFLMGNEPSFHIHHFYNYSGEPWKTQKRIRFQLDVWSKSVFLAFWVMKI